MTEERLQARLDARRTQRMAVMAKIDTLRMLIKQTESSILRREAELARIDASIEEDEIEMLRIEHNKRKEADNDNESKA